MSLDWTDFVVCRLELKGNKYILGEFLEFKGKQEDVQALRDVRRSKVSHMKIQQISMFGLGNFVGELVSYPVLQTDNA